MYGGKTTGDFSVNVAKKNASFKADARMSGINMAHLLAAFHETRGRMTGKLEGDLKLAGEIEHTQSPLAGMHGTGHVKVTNGKVPSLMLNANLMKLAHFNDLGPAKENPDSFSSISTDLELANQRITSKTIDIDGYGVDVDGSGSVSVSGSDDAELSGRGGNYHQAGLLDQHVRSVFGGSQIDRRQVVVSVPDRGNTREPEILEGNQGLGNVLLQRHCLLTLIFLRSFPVGCRDCLRHRNGNCPHVDYARA